MTRAFFLLAAALAACFGPPCLLAQIPSPPPPSRSIGGTVRLYDGRIPDFRVPVKLYMANQMLVDETFTDSSGRFEFHRLRGETFHIVVQVRGYEPVTEIVSLEIVLAARLPPLTLTPTPSPDDSYPVQLVLRSSDRPGLLKELTAAITDRTNIRNIETRFAENGEATIDLTLDITDKKHLEKLVTAMRKIHGVRDVERIYKV